MGVVAFVVGVQGPGGTNDLLVAAVAPGGVDPDRDRLVGPIGNDDSLAHLLDAGQVLARRRLLAWNAGRFRLGVRALALSTATLRLAASLGVPLGLALLGRTGRMRRHRGRFRRPRLAAPLLWRQGLRRLGRNGR